MILDLGEPPMKNLSENLRTFGRNVWEPPSSDYVKWSLSEIIVKSNKILHPCSVMNVFYFLDICWPSPSRRMWRNQISVSYPRCLWWLCDLRVHRTDWSILSSCLKKMKTYFNVTNITTSASKNWVGIIWWRSLSMSGSYSPSVVSSFKPPINIFLKTQRTEMNDI